MQFMSVAAAFVSWQYEWVAAELSTLDKERLVMFTDSDSIFQKGPEVITESFTGFPGAPRVVVSAECESREACLLCRHTTRLRHRVGQKAGSNAVRTYFTCYAIRAPPPPQGFCNPILQLGVESCARFPEAPNQYRYLNSGTYMG
jgi:hypothetical protein